METKSDIRTFQEVFVSNFHNKLSFSDFVNFDVSKNITIINVRGREVIRPSEKLKSIQHFLVKNVFEYATIAQTVVFSYRKGVNIRDAVSPHAASKFFYQTDVANFFGSITKNVVERKLKTQLGNVPIADLHDYTSLILELITHQNTLPLGFPTSPSISNTCLYDFDIELAQQCEQASIQYTRYADDIILSSNDFSALEEKSPIIPQLLKDLVHSNITLNEAKTRFLRRGQKIKLLGLVVLPNGQLSIDKSNKAEIEALLHFYLSDSNRFLEYAADIKEKKTRSDIVLSHDGALAMLSGRLIGVNAMAPDYLLKLRKKYGNTVIDMFLHKSAK
jgi:RNA-directed DNA polymerase